MFYTVVYSTAKPCACKQLFSLLFQTEVSTVGWIAMEFCTDIHGFQRMNPNDFGDPLTFPLAPPFVFLSEMSQQPLNGLS